MDEHRVGHCIFKDQIKRVLFYQVANIQVKDGGASAKLLLDRCLRDNEVVWTNRKEFEIDRRSCTV